MNDIINVDTLKPNKSDFIKLMAIILMTIDHIGAVLGKTLFEPQTVTLLRIIGRLAFPIFVYYIAVGCVNTKNIYKYAGRLLLLGLISQYPFMKAIHPQTIDAYFTLSAIQSGNLKIYVKLFAAGLNIFFTLLAGLGAIYIYDILKKINYGKYWGIIAVIPFAFLAQKFHSDYGAYGVIMIFLFYLTRYNLQMAIIAQMLLGLINYYQHPGIQVYSMLAVLIIFLPLLFNEGVKLPEIKLPKYFFYFFYPAHLIVLIVVKTLL